MLRNVPAPENTLLLNFATFTLRQLVPLLNNPEFHAWEFYYHATR